MLVKIKASCTCIYIYEPSHEIIALFVLLKLILQTGMPSHPVGLDVWFLVRPFVYFHTSCMQTAKLWQDCAMCRLRPCKLAWAFADRLCDMYHNLMSWLIYSLQTELWAKWLLPTAKLGRNLPDSVRSLNRQKYFFSASIIITALSPIILFLILWVSVHY